MAMGGKRATSAYVFRIAKRLSRVTHPRMDLELEEAFRQHVWLRITCYLLLAVLLAINTAVNSACLAARACSQDNQCSSFLKRLPPFMTNFTCCNSVMSLSGSPETATRSAHFPASTVPILSDQPSSSAAEVVAVRMACIGAMPYFT